VSFTIIVKNSVPKGARRTKDDALLEDSGWGSSFKSEEDKDKCDYLERKLKENTGLDDTRISAAWINRV